MKYFFYNLISKFNTGIKDSIIVDKEVKILSLKDRINYLERKLGDTQSLLAKTRKLREKWKDKYYSLKYSGIEIKTKE